MPVSGFAWPFLCVQGTYSAAQAAKRPLLGMTKESQLDHMGDASSLSCLGERLGQLQPFSQARQLTARTFCFES